MRLRNFTPHTISFRDPNNLEKEVLSLPSEGQIRAVTVRNEMQKTCRINEKRLPITVNTVSFGVLEGVPDLAKGEFLLVSAVAASAAKETSHPLASRMLTVDQAVRFDAELGLNMKRGDIVGALSLAQLR